MASSAKPPSGKREQRGGSVFTTDSGDYVSVTGTVGEVFWKNRALTAERIVVWEEA